MARIFGDRDVKAERVAQGVSTYISRVRHHDATWFLRILPEEGASFAPEVAAHNRLRDLGVRVPEVVHFAHLDEDVHRSVMVTTAVRGGPVAPATPHADARRVFADAGRDLALLNSVPVDGFGWIRRDSDDVTLLAAEHKAHGAFVMERWRDDIAFLGERALARPLCDRLEALAARYGEDIDTGRATLAHGDFDTTHIFQEDGRYTGIIDLGEIRGTSSWYDLGHFHLHDGERLPYRALTYLLLGYGEVAPLPGDVHTRIRLSALFIGVRTLARTLRKRPPNAYTRHLIDRVKDDAASFGT